jgi:hypothetical protein
MCDEKGIEPRLASAIHNLHPILYTTPKPIREMPWTDKCPDCESVISIIDESRQLSTETVLAISNWAETGIDVPISAGLLVQ